MQIWSFIVRVIRESSAEGSGQLRYNRQPGILCGWSGRLEQSPTGHSFGTYIINVKNMLKTSFLTFLLHWLNCFAEYEQRILHCSDSSDVTAPYSCRFIISSINIYIYGFWLSVSGVHAANSVRRPWSDSNYITAPFKLSFFLLFIIIISRTSLSIPKQFQQLHLR